MTWDNEDSNPLKPTVPLKGRGAASHVTGRFASTAAVGVDDGWGSVYEDQPRSVSFLRTNTNGGSNLLRRRAL